MRTAAILASLRAAGSRTVKQIFSTPAAERRPRHAFPAEPEELEGRRLLSGATFASGVVTATGTSGGETIRVYRTTSSGIFVKIGSTVYGGSWTAGSVNRIDVDGLGGNDTIIVEGTTTTGNLGDTIVAKDTRLYGGDGDDQITGGDNSDYIYGGDGTDTIRGNAADDTVLGGAGDDYLYGDGHNDYVAGDSGNDNVEGGSGDDQLYGDDDTDWITGGSGNDYVFGGSGDDFFYMDDGVGENIAGGDGYDTCLYRDQSDNLMEVENYNY